MRRPGNEPGHMTKFKMADNTCTIFYHSNLSAFVQKKQKMNEWMETLQNVKENFSCKLCFHQDTWQNATDFPIVIVDLQDSSWMTDGHQPKWCMKLGKDFVLIYFPCFIKLGVVQLCIFVSLCKLQNLRGKKNILNYYTRLDMGTKMKKQQVC